MNNATNNKDSPDNRAWLNSLTEPLKTTVIKAMASFDKEKEKIYQILPADCLLKPHEALCLEMVGAINQKFLDLGIYSRQDICSLCTMNMCPWYSKVNVPYLRRFKIKILSLFLRFSDNIAVKTLNKSVRWF